VIGAANFSTHYSVMIKVQEEAHPIVLSEGVPQIGELEENTPYYAMISVHDPNVTKVAF
jgi:hypothetical protein